MVVYESQEQVRYAGHFFGLIEGFIVDAVIQNGESGIAEDHFLVIGRVFVVECKKVGAVTSFWSKLV